MKTSIFEGQMWDNSAVRENSDLNDAKFAFNEAYRGFNLRLKYNQEFENMEFSENLEKELKYVNRTFNKYGQSFIEARPDLTLSCSRLILNYLKNQN